MLFKQFVDDDLGCASYLIGDERSGEAVLVDPAFAIEPYLAEAKRRGVRIVRVLETHTHADHVSGHGRPALEHQVPASIHPAAEVAFAFDPLEDGAERSVGAVSLRVVHTPGHRPEHCCFLVSDRSRAQEPWLVLSGDSLLVGETARPDLAVAAREGARDLFDSLRRLLELEDGVELYPGHVAGSLCGAGMSSKASSTIGYERRFNPSLGVDRAEDFVQATAEQGSPRPPNMERIVELNRGLFVGRPPELPRVSSPGESVVLDVRPAEQFFASHVEGALNVPVSGSAFATKAAFLLSPEEPIVVHAGSQEEAGRAARGLNSVGFLELEGYLDQPETSARLAPLGLGELEELMSNGAVELIDVREKNERDEAYIPGSRHIPYRLLRASGAALAGERPVATICESGARAAIAASVLAASGIDARPVQNGGVGAWKARGNAVTSFRRCGT